MKSKVLLAATICLSLIIFGSCKTNKENIQSSYEKATSDKPKTTVYVVEEVSPVEKRTEVPDVPQKEKLTTISGPAISTYSVVIGSFVNKTNASALKKSMEDEGYSPSLAQNEKGMYRVILSTFAEQYKARNFRDEVIKKHSPRFQDAWVLEQEK